MVARIAIIPARGGSKRIPRKNIIAFGGKPMIAWAIEAALQSKLFDRVLVSTDDKEIATVSEEYGATVPFLRTSCADDVTPVSEAIVSALHQVESELGERYETVVQLMANCPMRTADDIAESVKFFEQGEHQFQISSFKFGWMNPWWAAEADSNGVPNPLFPKAMKMRSQDLPDLYCPTGAIWIANVEAFCQSKTFYGDDFRYKEINWVSAVDIDDRDDLMMAEAFFQMRQKALVG